ncbi:bifunctional UDP-N-acetylglucosamine diphosphorylase/glucosamine-1-phosphate N-acetyltransferase GlmU (plasmid) [Leisingera sp. NJS201]|uniref:bifunctional UDP-N-acetylglucosamine diphosphorylase/glucosamine-1-phosphate N-acetyltransferase GlmU n=1 Tax=Leisingera sp. NJS201 TaxID=2508306 RepID=UPI001070AE0A|nr:bifunctional UDP-N-acetylglucosamine diphosphorylase/glucosamine-1-phosphate N-acetyltransferase GlmU [Leisingera sp. NJS201]QBR38547.1 bifunctional UDP-N-acetylglucosamine diphosphorylase/glucosamine-1-phosphate N-acetyltransferase GlmU [Leisingera sp. NJS201]
MPLAIVVLAAGRGTRMVSSKPKVLHPIAGLPMLFHAMGTASELQPERRVVVAGFGAEQVSHALQDYAPDVEVAIQEEQLGTAHAADQARSALEDFDGDVIVLFGDTPFIRTETLKTMLDARRAKADVVVLGFEPDDPARYGRLVLADGRLQRIVEAKDASPQELQIGLCNSGVICASRKNLFDLISRIGCGNAAQEYYLTDIVEKANEAGLACSVVTCSEDETLGINSRAELARAEAIFQNRARQAAMAVGVTLVAPETVFFAPDTRLDRDVLVEPHVVFGPGVEVEQGAVVRAFSHLEGCQVGREAVIGPYARLRPGSSIGAGAKIGNFVETKNATLEAGAKVNHLSYLGDAHVGAAANIGAGTITCNYDGVLKHRTEVGAGAFIGSNSALVAPVSVGAGAIVAAGSVITREVPPEALALGRAEQDNKAGAAERLRQRQRARKTAAE